ncbi:electrogenic sodium bicarbonate cotransporter 1 isoform X5 [Syngnathus acus]|uniref:electrogenic sodium bicarbonate cotransporter 1 isoform X5 n=1 Tax=Syngnathus acus TaxID=161584 RepID=UPI001885B340|nr:electrogenic sodium bicarbonate cotransporter 1 isoform X5 [Syngnathus acus]
MNALGCACPRTHLVSSVCESRQLSAGCCRLSTPSGQSAAAAAAAAATLVLFDVVGFPTFSFPLFLRAKSVAVSGRRSAGRKSTMDQHEWRRARDRGHCRYDDNGDEDVEASYLGSPASRRQKRRRRRSSERRHDGEHAARRSHYERRACQEHSQHARPAFYRDSDNDDDQGRDRHAQIVERADLSVSPAAERLRHILGEDDGTPTPTIFTEMDTLQQEGGELEWKESARWVKFEEKVEEGGERWSKPHVSTLTLHSLFELRTCLQTGSILLDLEAFSLAQIVDEMVERQIAEGLISEEVKDKIVFVLLRKHRHQTKKPIHRSLADIGKSSAAGTNRSPQANLSRTSSAVRRSTDDLPTRRAGSLGGLHHAQSRSMNDISETPSSDQMRNKFMKKIPRDAEASNVLIGEVDFLDKPFVSFVRLAQAATLGGLTEVPVPTRFLFILLGPPGKTKSYNEIGRAIATLMVDELFSDVAYKAREREDLIAGLDEFLDEVIVLPPGEWDPKIRIEPPKKVPSAEMRKSVLNLNEPPAQTNGSAGGAAGGDDEQLPVQHAVGEELKFTGRLGGGLWLDVKRKTPWYCSDIYDGFHIQSVSAVLFIYLGCITNAITFGGLLGDATDNYQGVMESFLGTALAGSVFCLFGGQPLIILSSTGPILIFEKLLYEFCKNNSVDYMELRLWIGIHSCLQCLVLVLSDASYIIQYMTRFTEEGFSSLISFIFISDAIKKMVGAFKYYPINRSFKPDYATSYKCDCVAPDQGEFSSCRSQRAPRSSRSSFVFLPARWRPRALNTSRRRHLSSSGRRQRVASVQRQRSGLDSAEQDGVRGVRRRPGGQSVQVRARSGPHVLHPLLRHLLHDRGAQEVQVQPLLPHQAASADQRLCHRHLHPSLLRTGRLSGPGHGQTAHSHAHQAHARRPRLVGDAVREESVVVVPGQLRAGAAGHHPDLHGPADQRRHRQPQGEQTQERLRVPPGPVLGGHPDGRVLLHGAAVVRGRHSHLHRAHRLAQDGERVQRPRGAAPVPGGPRAEADRNSGLCPHGTFCVPRPRPAVHPHAGAVRRLPLHGCGFAQRDPVLGAHQVVPDAAQAPAGLCLPASCPSAPSPPFHPGPDHLPGRPLGPQVHLPGHHLPRDDPGSDGGAEASGYDVFPA